MEASSEKQLITTVSDDLYSSLPDLHPLPEVGYLQEKAVLVYHEQFAPRIHQQTLHMAMDNQSELELQQHDTTSLLKPAIQQFYSLQPIGC